MIVLALIPVLGLIIIIAISVTAITVRGNKIQKANQKIANDGANILRQDRANDELLVNSIVEGLPFDDVFARHENARGRLVPTSDGKLWTADDLVAWQQQQKLDAASTVQRQILLPTLLSSLATIAAVVVVEVVLYQSQSPAQATGIAEMADFSPPSVFPEMFPSSSADDTFPQPMPMPGTYTSESPNTQPQPFDTADKSKAPVSSPSPVQDSTPNGEAKVEPPQKSE